MGEEPESRSGSEAGGEASTSRRDESADAVKYPVLQFAPWQSAVDEGFWRRLADLKLDILGIAQTPIEITGFYAPCSHEQVSNHMQLLFESLPPDPGGETSISGNRNRCPIPGILYNTNTLDTFNALDRQALFKLEVEKIWEDIHSGRVEEDSRLLCRFLVISFADLKNWSFYYWFGFPALVLNPPAMLSDIRPASEIFSGEEGASLLVACNEWRSSTQTAGMPFFLVHMVSNGHVRVRPLIEWESCRQGGGKVFLGFYDPCHLPNNPGWPLRNFLAFAAARWGLDRVKVICYREKRGLADLQQCLVADILLSIPKDWRNCERVPEALGWERNSRGKMGPRCINLAMSMDPHRLAISAADLNVKLIRWRAVPSLNLALLSATKCLLLGAGTLGCQVARGLMAWGFRQITLVDSGRVAMSNPLRQSLYSFEDCLNGGRLKAVAAAESLKCIFPGIEAEGISMTIPMPGHPVEDNEIPAVMKDCACLKSLIDSHDVIFLLTDTRESRWLPTLLCADANKVAITAALGFDSYLVMRHGAGVALPCDSEASAECNVEASPLEMEERVDEKQRLGCYFCNDVVAPVDSTVNRTLDQQCTVTRPGLAPIAAALAVELTVAILHHPLGITAPACEATSDSPSSIDQPLGILPHQIRGHLALFSMSLLKGNSFNRCTACCEMVVSEFRERGMDFVLQAINEPTYLEDLTGLTELMRLARSFNLDWEDSSEVDDECENLDLQHMNI